MAQLTYREAVAAGIAQEMERDPRVVLLGEDVGPQGGVFKTTVGLFARFGPERVWDTPISEQAILGSAMGAAMTGLRPVAEIMFSDFLAVCWDVVANQMAKMRYMTDGQVTVPVVIKTGNGGGLRFGAQHSQALENWAMAVPGIKVVAPATPADVKGLMASAIRDPDPVLFFEAKALYGTSGEVPEGECVEPLGVAKIVRPGSHCTLVALGPMVPRSLEAAEQLAAAGIDAQVIDVRSLVPLDTRTILGAISATSRAFPVEENPRLCGWGAEIASLAGEECFYDLDGPIVRITLANARRARRSPSRHLHLRVDRGDARLRTLRYGRRRGREQDCGRVRIVLQRDGPTHDHGRAFAAAQDHARRRSAPLRRHAHARGGRRNLGRLGRRRHRGRRERPRPGRHDPDAGRRRTRGDELRLPGARRDAE
jgi:pyruvate dehydrogenase E1 component beta subunit